MTITWKNIINTIGIIFIFIMSYISIKEVFTVQSREEAGALYVCGVIFIAFWTFVVLVPIVSVFVNYFTGAYDHILDEPAFRIKLRSDSKEDFKQDLLKMLKEARRLNDKEEITRIENSLELINRK